MPGLTPSKEASMTNLDSIFKSRDMTLLTKVRLVKAMVFPVIRYGCESWTVKKSERRRINAFELWCWRRLLRVPWTAARQASLSITNSWSLLKLMSIELVMPSNHLILGHPLLLPPSIFPSIRVFPNESILHIWWPKYWSFSISPSNEYSGLISFRIDWFDLLAVQGTIKSVLQHHSSKASIQPFLWQLSYPYMTTGKTIVWLDGLLLTKWCLCFLKHRPGLT